MSVNMAGECEKHNLEWYDKDVIECPVCKLEADLAAAVEELKDVREWFEIIDQIDTQIYSEVCTLLARLESGEK